MEKAVQILGVDFSKLTPETLAAIAKEAGVPVSAIMPTKPKKVSLGKLEGQLDEQGNYTCPFCKKVTNYNDLDDEAKAKARKTGICPDCQKLADFLSANKIRNLASAPREKHAVTAADACKAVIMPHVEKFTEEQLANFQDAKFCKTELKLAYPLFQEIPAGLSKTEKDEKRKVNGYARYGAIVYEFQGRHWLLTNDFYYNKNVSAIEAYFTKLFAEQVEETIAEDKADA